MLKAAEDHLLGFSGTNLQCLCFGVLDIEPVLLVDNETPLYLRGLYQIVPEFLIHRQSNIVFNDEFELCSIKWS